MKILITGGKTLTALKLIKAFPGYQILLADYGDMPIISSDLYQFVPLEVWNEEIAAHHLLTKCLDFGVDALLPLYEGEIAAVSKSLLLFEEFGLKVFVPASVHYSYERFISKYICVFDQGELQYTNLLEIADLLFDQNKKLNGAYYYNPSAKEFSLIQHPNPA